jgi:putative endonuclease
MSFKTKKRGDAGETAARSYLESLGFTILDTNWRTRFAEIDIIAKDGDTLCFIEVKTRYNLKKGMPAEAVTLPKQKKIIQAALFYCQKKKIDHPMMRFDVVEVLMVDETLSVNLIKHAFQAT